MGREGFSSEPVVWRRRKPRAVPPFGKNVWVQENGEGCWSQRGGRGKSGDA